MRRRASFAATAYAFAVTMLGTTLPTPLYGLYGERFGFSVLMITVIFATYAAGVIAALLLFGSFSDEIGRRRTLLPALALSALSAVAFLLAHGLAPLLVGRALSGLSAGIFTGTATATLVDLVAAEDRGRATLVATIANMGGLGLGPLLAGIISQAAASPLRLPFWVDLALVASAVALVWKMCEPVDTSGPTRLSPQGLSVPGDVRATFCLAQTKLVRSLRKVLTSSGMLPAGMCRATSKGLGPEVRQDGLPARGWYGFPEIRSPRFEGVVITAANYGPWLQSPSRSPRATGASCDGGRVSTPAHTVR